MKKLFILLFILGLVVNAYGRDFARRYPTDTALEVVTPGGLPALETDPLSLHLDQTAPQTFTNLGVGTGLMKVTAGLLGLDVNTYLTTGTAATTYLKLDCSNDPLTNTLDGFDLDFTGHMRLGADALWLPYTILNIDETLLGVDTTMYGIFSQLNMEPWTNLSAITTLVAMDMQAQYNSTEDASVFGYIHGIKGEGVNLSEMVGAGDIKELVGVYGKASNLGISNVTNVIGGLFTATNDDGFGNETGNIASACSVTLRAYTDKTTGTITDRYGLYVADTTGGGNLANQYGIYLEDIDAATTINYAIYSLGGDVELTDGNIVTTGTLGAGATTVNGTMAATTVTGVNVTSGADPGHTHTAGSITEADPLATTLTGWTHSGTSIYPTTLTDIVGINTTDLDGTPTIGQLTVKGTTNDGTTNIFVGRDSDEANVFSIDTNGLATGTFSGNLTGNITGNAATATALETARTIGGVSFDGTASVTPTTITVADTTDTTCYVGLWEDAVGDLLPKTDAGITYNAGTANLSTTTFTGALAGNASTVTNGAYTTDNLSVFSSTTSAQLYGILSDETGSASGTPLAVFNVNPTLTGATIPTSSQLIFRDAQIYIASLNDGYLDVEADTAIRLNADVNVTGNTFLLTDNYSLQCRDAQLYVNSDADTFLDLHADGAVRITAPYFALGNAAATAGILQINEDTSDGTNYASFTVPALAANTVYTLPPAFGAAGTVFTDAAGNGVLSWTAAGSGDITSVGDVATGAAFDGTQGTTLTFYNVGGNATLAYNGTTFTPSVFITGNVTGALTGNASTATTAANLSGTPALPNGTTATTQAAGSNDTKLATDAYADAKVADVITDGVTGIAPSENAVFDALALKSTLASPTFTGTVTLPAATYTVGWTDYFATSTITGWAASPTGTIYTKKIGTTVFVSFAITGTSNATTGSFTLPYTSAAAPVSNLNCIRVLDGGAWIAGGGMVLMGASTTTVDLYKQMDGAAFTNSGTRTVQGSFFYEST